MASSNSVMNRVKMFEQSASPSDLVTSPSPEQGRQMQKYGRTSPASDPPKWQKKINTTERKVYSPVIRGKGGALFSESTTDTHNAGNSSVWPSPEMKTATPPTGSILPSQIASQNRKLSSPAKSATSSILGARDPKSSMSKTTPVYLNRKSPQPESPYSGEVRKLNKSPVVGWPSSEKKDAKQKVAVRVTPVLVAKESDPASISASQDENEAPPVAAAPAVDARTRAQSLEADGARTSQRPRHPDTEADGASATGTVNSVGSLQRNLKDASVVMQDERESVASGSTSARSSLSVDELSSIAFRALRAAREEEKQEKPLPKAITTQQTTTQKPAKSPRRRRQLQRFSQKHGHVERRGPASKPKYSTASITSNISTGNKSKADKESSPVTSNVPGKQRDETSTAASCPATKASTRISVVSNETKRAKGTVSTTASVTQHETRVDKGNKATASAVSNGKSALGKSRNQLFEAARQRNRSPSPLTMAASPAEKNTTAKKTAKGSAAPNPENDSAARRALLSAGRRRIASGGPLGIANASIPPGYSHQSSFDTISTNASEGESTDTSTRDSSQKSRRAHRMAVMAAAHRHSPVPRTTKKTDASTVSSSKSLSSEDSSTKRARPGTSFAKSSRSARMLALSTSSNITSPQVSPANSKKEVTTSSSNARSESHAATSLPVASSRQDKSTPPDKAGATKAEVKRKPNDSKRFNGKASPDRSAFSSPQPSPYSAERKPSGESRRNKEEHATAGPRQSALGSSPGRSRPASARISDHPAMRAKRGAGPSSPRSQRRSAQETSRSPSLRRDRERPKLGQGDDVREKSNFRTSHGAGESEKMNKGAPNEVSSSPGGVKAAIDAWTSKSKETRKDEQESAPSSNASGSCVSHTSAPGNHSVHSREAKLSDGSFHTQESCAISSEVSAGGSHTSTYFSSPSSHTSSKMSVGAPGSFFRPMGAENDFVEARKDNMLGQLSGTSTDEESSVLPSHLYDEPLKEDKSRHGDTELSFLLEQMKSESESEDSGIKYLTSGTTLTRAAQSQDHLVKDQFKSYSDESSSNSTSYVNSNSQKTSSTTPNERSTLLGPSLLESGESSDQIRPTGDQPVLNEFSESSDSSDSRFIKWWQNTDPAKRRQKFEPHAAPSSRPVVNSLDQPGPRTQLTDEDDLFSGLSYDETQKSNSSNLDQQVASFGEDIFSGVTPSADSRDSQQTNSPAAQSAKNPTFPPPPPPPPLQTSTSDQFGTILVHGSQAVDSVGSDITSSVLDNMPRDWVRREATAVIKEELTAEIEDEEDTTHGDVLSDRRNEGSTLSPDGKSLNAGDQLLPGNNTGIISETPKGDSIFMNLGCSVMEPFSFTEKFCAPPGTSPSGSSLVTNERDGYSQTSTAQGTLNDYEKKVWDEWNRQDSQSELRYESPEAKSISPQALKRRESAHQKLQQYAEAAKSLNGSAERHESLSPREEAHTKKEASDSDHSSDLAPSVDPVGSPEEEKLSLSQRRILEKFSSTLKLSGMEVLKLNRDKKWQTRFLVVSKEVLLPTGEGGVGASCDGGQCPIGLLWTKRFTAGRDYSISAIDRHGKGGMHFDQLTNVSASGRSNVGHALSKKQQEKFRDSVVITIEYIQNESKKSVVLLCRSTDSAHFLCTGLRVVMDVLKSKNDDSEDEI